MNRIVFNVKEVAKYLSVSESTIRKLVRENDIPYYRIYSKILFDKDIINLWLKEKQN